MNYYIITTVLEIKWLRQWMLTLHMNAWNDYLISSGKNIYIIKETADIKHYLENPLPAIMWHYYKGI